MDARISSFREALDVRPLTGFQIRLLAIAVILLIMDGYDVQAIGYIAPVLAKLWHLDRSAFAPIFGAGLVGLTVGTLVFSPLSDRIGCRPVLICCTLLFAILTLATTLADSWGVLLALRFLTGLGLGGIMPSVIALVSDYAPTRRRTTMVMVSLAGFAIGGALGGFVAAAVIQTYGWQSVLVLGGVIPLAAMPLILLWLPEALPRLLADSEPRTRLARVAEQVVPGWTVPDVAPVAVAKAERFPVAALFARGYAASTLLFWTVFVCNLLLVYFFVNWIPSLVTDSGQSLESANVAAGMFQLAGIVGGLLQSYLSDRTRKTQAILASGYFGAALCCFVFGAATQSTPAALIAVSAAAGFCIVGSNGVVSAFAGSYYPAAVRATGVGWGLGMGRFGSILGSLAGGILLSLKVSTPILFACFAIPALIASLCILLIRRSPDLVSSATPLEAAPSSHVPSAI